MYKFRYDMFIVNPFIFSQGTSYLVDTYSPTAAYSLRKLSSSATNAIRVRRSSDSSEQDIGFSGDDLDTASLSSFVGANSGYVVKWYNQGTGGASYDMIQSTAAKQPRIVNAGTIDTKNSLPTCYFDGTDDGLAYTTGAVFPSAGNPLSYFTVSHNDESAVFSYLLNSTAVGGGNRLSVFNDRRTTPYRNLLIQTSTSTYYADMSASRNDANLRLLSGFVDSSNNMSSFDNGTTGGTSTYVDTYGNSKLSVGFNGGTGNELMGGIQEILIFSTDESANRAAIETNINAYYSIY